MTLPIFAILMICAASLGATLAWFGGRARAAFALAQAEFHERRAHEVEARLETAQHALNEAREEVSRQRERLSHYEERLTEQTHLFHLVEERLENSFRTLSSEALSRTTEQFSSHFNQTARALLEQVNGQSKSYVESGHKLIDSVSRSIAEKLSEVDRSVRDIEKLRISGDAELRKQVEQLLRVNASVGAEASKLSQALTNSRVQGSWGEFQLRNIVEAAGMIPYCDFVTQDSTTSECGDGYRPDMRVRLPNGLNVLIDAKTPSKAFVEALHAPDERGRAAKLKELTTSLRSHIRTLGKRDYPTHFAPALEYTLLFLPSESLFVAAVEHDSDLLTFSEQHRVILTTPLSLIAFLRAVACGWTQQVLHTNAEEIQRLGKELFERLTRFYDRFHAVGRSLEGAVRSYNDAAATGRTLGATRRKFAELGTGDPASIESPEEIATEVRVTEQSAAELRTLALSTSPS